ncbi:MAG: pyridoxamine 5'-phosphate oxidase [Gemmatimonadetes bacterium]|nr:pyridoxamine 5'-phosphate oxidase [Gemmatimonadota bacterium]MYB99397.1 pyridoxamine 5'-phosphate oxidase [Gemmatimonadota bacterium]MYH52449.1 pyridoxamine 5'-phosphate oxidase [Gemmatimonadota bacterium]MYK67027.1 pyridoxamine 5'-phosphate oxidase [Gemmatimonadota bacterium]
MKRRDLSPDPVEQFGRWFAEAEAEPRIVFAEAVCLSTLGPGGTPEGRMVLLKHFDERGFVFYTNLESAKSRSLNAHRRAGMTFYWQPLGRQVRVRGEVETVSAAEADDYFASRPRGSQLGAWASDQSRVLASRAALEARLAAVEARHADGEVPRPPHWSGYRIVPDTIEFWQEGAARLHDRFQYRRGRAREWEVRRLYP